MPQGFALTNAATGEVFAYSSGRSDPIPGVAATPGWQVIGAFFFPFTFDVRLDVIALVSDPSLTVRVRLFDMTTAEPVSGATAQTTSQTSARALSGVVSLQGNRVYEIQAECTGAAGDDFFAIVQNATVSE
jgi:hypothetical protein